MLINIIEHSIILNWQEEKETKEGSIELKTMQSGKVF
jgi:hypothetical protein